MAKISKKTAAVATIDQRKKSERRNASDRRATGHAVAVERRGGERREKVARRRQIDPTTCERDYTPEEVEFMHALEQYKRTNGRMFPTCSEVLEVLRGLGYEKQNRAGQAAAAGQGTVEPCRCEADEADSIEDLEG